MTTPISLRLMPRLVVSLLGAPRIEREGAPIEVDTRKAIALLAYLAVTGQSHTRDALANLLWPEYDQEHARGALRRTLSTLKNALPRDALEVGRERIGLVRDSELAVDIERFRTLLAEDRLDAAEQGVELYRGDFLAGFTLRDSVNFDDWQYFEADSLRRELAGALDRLADAYAAHGDYERAIGHARRRLALDPLHEPAHRRLMQLYAWKGDRAAALRQYRECVRVLDAELGVAPLEETTEIYAAIKENRLRVPEQTTSSAPRGGPGARAAKVDLPLVGRAGEWRAVLEAYAAAGAGHLLVVEGEAGIGKTRLAEELLAHAHAEGARTVAARCYEDEKGLAYAPVVQALRTAVGRIGDAPADAVAEAARLLPGVAASPPALPLESPGAQSRFFDGLATVLTAACAGRPPGVLFVDDVHWADEASLDVLTYLARRLDGRPVCVVLTWRSEDMPAADRLRRLLAERQRAGAATHVTLRRLGEAEVGELARFAAADAGEEVSERLYRETGGLPLFVVEYLNALEQPDAEGSLPGGIRELLLARLAPLSETANQLLTTAAAIGRSFDVELVRQASGRGDEETVAALEELTGRALLEETGDAYDFRHEQLRPLVYEETSLARRRLLHRRIAEALAARQRGREAAAVVAHHYRLAGRDAEAAEYFRIAGVHARSLYANAEALAHFRTALALGHPDTAALHEQIGDLQTLLGDYAGALASYEAAAAQAASSAGPAIEHKLGNLHHRRGDWELAQAHFEAALAALDDQDSAGARARVYADSSLAAHRQGKTKTALDRAGQALVLAEQAADVQASAQARNILGILATSRGDLEVAHEHLERSLALAETVADPAARVAALNNLALAYRAGGALERAVELTERALSLCAAQGDRHREAALHNNLADLLHAAGRSEEAMSHLKQAVGIFAEIGGREGEHEPEIWKLVEW